MTSAPPPAAATVPLIPREALFGNPERLSPQISPDGRSLAFLAPDAKDVLQVWCRTLEGTDDACLTADPRRGIRSFFWTATPDRLIYVQDADGDENFHLYSVDVRSRAVRDLTPYPGVRAQVVAVEPEVPGEILAGLNLNDRRKHDVYRIRLETGEARLDTENPGTVTAWAADRNLHVRAALAATPDGGHEIWIRDAPEAAWETVRVFGPDDQGAPLEFSKDGRTLYLISSLGANAQRLTALDLQTRRETVLAEDPQYDVAGALFHPVERTPQAVSFYKDTLQWKALDPDVSADFDRLSRRHRGELHIQPGDVTGRHWIVAVMIDDGPAAYYRYDRHRKESAFLFSQRRALEGMAFSRMQPLVLAARDGLTIHGYLTRPLAPGPSPAVLLVHGGPWARDRWGFNAMVQWLANRGYAVLQVNYRGSTGYGKAFLNAGNREWAGKMHDDLVDAVQWLAAQGIADPRRVAIMGGSYGGYAALVGLTFTPDLFACGVDIVGPSNLITLIQTIPPYWEPMRATFARRLGVLDRDEAFMKSRSPLFFVDRIQKPLLIGQGANDPRVKQAESDQIVEAMRRNGKPVDYIIYADEGHGFLRPQNRMHFYARVEQFLAKHLGGRSEPPNDPPGHSGQER